MLYAFIPSISHLPFLSTSKTILKRLLDAYKDYLEEKNISLEVRSVMAIISKAKSRGESPRDLATRTKPGGDQCASQTGHDIDRITTELYESYEKFLRENNSLDFDDLLVYGVKLFSQDREVINWCRHVLVDELYVAPPCLFIPSKLVSFRILLVRILIHCNMSLCGILPPPPDVSRLWEIRINPVRIPPLCCFLTDTDLFSLRLAIC